MPRDIRKPQKPLREFIAPRVPNEDKDRFRNACKESEKETAERAKEFVEHIGKQDEWTLDDWCELADLADTGRTLMEMRIAME